MDSKGYKWATIILLILVIILGWKLMAKGGPAPATEGVSDATSSVNDCRTAIAGWTAKYSSPASVTAEARAELDGILNNCQNKIGR